MRERETTCSTPDLDPGDPSHSAVSDADDLEYEYEPGISLADLEFGREEDATTRALAIIFARQVILLKNSTENIFKE